MKTQHILFAILLAAFAGCLGAFASDYWRDEEPSGGLHQFVHDELELSPEQNSQLEALESRYAVEKSELEASLRAANARLARAMEAEHEYGPEVSAAIDDVHEKMGNFRKRRCGTSSTCANCWIPTNSFCSTVRSPML